MQTFSTFPSINHGSIRKARTNVKNLGARNHDQIFIYTTQ